MKQYRRKFGITLFACQTLLGLTHLVGSNMAQPIGGGAVISWQEYQAEQNSAYQGRMIGPSFELTEDNIQAAEAVGRQAVVQEKRGDFVEWVITDEADIASIRFSLPVEEEDRKEAGAIQIFVDGKFLQRVALPRDHMWVFGNKDLEDRLLQFAWTDH